MKPYTVMSWIPPLVGFETGTLWTEVGSNNHRVTQTRLSNLGTVIVWWFGRDCKAHHWVVMLCMLEKHQQTFWNIFLFFLENRLWYFMQIVSYGDNLHEMSKSIFWKKMGKIWPVCRLLNLHGEVEVKRIPLGKGFEPMIARSVDEHKKYYYTSAPKPVSMAHYSVSLWIRMFCFWSPADWAESYLRLSKFGTCCSFAWHSALGRGARTGHTGGWCSVISVCLWQVTTMRSYHERALVTIITFRHCHDMTERLLTMAIDTSRHCYDMTKRLLTVTLASTQMVRLTTDPGVTSLNPSSAT